MIKMDNKNVTWLTFKPGKQPPFEKKINFLEIVGSQLSRARSLNIDISPG